MVRSAGFGSLARVEALVGLPRREPGAVEALGGAIAVEGRQSGRQVPAVGTGSDPPDERRVIGVGRDGAPQGAGDAGSVGPAVVAHQSAGLDLAGEVLAGALQAVAETAGGRQRIEQVDQESGQEGVHLRPRLLEARRGGVGGEPVARLLLVLAQPRRRRPEGPGEVLAGGRLPHGQLALPQVMPLSLLGGPGEAVRRCSPGARPAVSSGMRQPAGLASCSVPRTSGRSIEGAGRDGLPAVDDDRHLPGRGVAGQRPADGDDLLAGGDFGGRAAVGLDGRRDCRASRASAPPARAHAARERRRVRSASPTRPASGRDRWSRRRARCRSRRCTRRRRWLRWRPRCRPRAGSTSGRSRAARRPPAPAST